jgi:oxygen-independent coproporphyrinogen-3 oxidase
MARLLEGCRCLLPLTSEAEVTLEANPGTIERGQFADYRSAGITRVSLGAQSFSDTQLKQLGRIHAADDTRRAAEELHAAGLSNFNLDLMYGLPRQSEAQALADIDAALALSPAHVSHYQLTLEPGTLFAAQVPEGLPDTDMGADLQRACQERLAAQGFVQYEVSAYARPGARCRHNLNYWEFGDYLGIGAGAHGKRSSADSEGGLAIVRTARWREPRRYLAGIERDDAGADGAAPLGAIAEEHGVSAAQRPFEYLMNALRLRAGFSSAQFQQRTGLPVQALLGSWEPLEQRGLLMRAGGQWRATARGFDLLNDVLAAFVPEG